MSAGSPMAGVELDVPYDLDADHVRRFAEEGWVALPGLLSSTVVGEIRDALADVAFRPPPSGADSPYLDVTPEDAQQSLRKQEGLAWRIPLFERLGNSARVAGTAVRLMGKDEALFVQDSTFYKPAGGTETGFHQDLPFFPFDRTGSITLWIALVDMTPDMGPLRYVEGSHRDGLLGRFISQDLRDSWPHLHHRAVVAGEAMRAGDAQAHWDVTVHGAAANRSDRPREAYTLRYMPSTTIYTGSPHPHFDTLGLKAGSRFADHPGAWKVGPAGRTEPGAG